MADSGSKLLAGKQVVETAGTRVQLKTSGASFTGRSVIIQALSTNEGEIVVGDSTVVAKAGTHASPERIGIALVANATLAIDVNDAAQCYIDATKSGDGVSYVALLAWWRASSYTNRCPLRW